MGQIQKMEVNNSIAIGSRVTVTKSNEIVLGLDTHSVYIPGQIYLEKPIIYLNDSSSSSSPSSSTSEPTPTPNPNPTTAEPIETNASFVVPSEGKVGYTVNVDLEPILITLDGNVHSVGSIRLDVGVWIITYGVNFTNGSGDITGANISRIQYGLSENIDTISLVNSMNDISELTVVNYNKPYYANGLVQVITNTEVNKTYYLSGSILAIGEGLIFGGKSVV